MRTPGTPATLNELMGSGDQPEMDFSLGNIKNILGEGTPEISFDKVGRLRLLTALRNRFGDNYRNIPGVKELLSEFDKETLVDLVTNRGGQQNGQPY